MANNEKTKSLEPGETGRRTARGAPLVFIGHDNRDAELAEAFSKLLSSTSAGVLKSFRSSDRKGSQGIEYGVEWYPELMRKLESASEVVCLLTQRSLDRPWILYEAGVAKGKLNTPVYGVALGIPLSKVNTGPFAQFQNCDDKEESLTKLVVQLLVRVPESEPDPEAIGMQVKRFKERVNVILKKIEGLSESQEVEPHADASSTAKLFEEIKVMFQDLPSRIGGRLLEEMGPIRRHRLRHFHPMIVEELTHMLSEDLHDPIGLLVIAGFVRDDLPWLYEVIMEAYREAKAGDTTSARKALQRIKRASNRLIGGPWLEEFGIHAREMEMLMMELPMVLEHYLERFETRIKKRSSRQKEGATEETHG